MLTGRSRLLHSGGVLGVACGVLGGYHGVGEVLQGVYTPNSVFFDAWGGPSCIIRAGENYCFTAFSLLGLIPTSLQVVGIVVLIGSIVAFVTGVLALLNKAKWYPLVAASLILLLFGGGAIAPILGIVGGGFIYYGRKGEVVASVAPNPASHLRLSRAVIN